MLNSIARVIVVSNLAAVNLTILFDVMCMEIIKSRDFLSEMVV